MSDLPRQNSRSRSLGALVVFAAAIFLQGATLVVFENKGHAARKYDADRVAAPVFTYTVTTTSTDGAGSIYDAVRTLNDTPTCDLPGSCLVNFDLQVGATVDMTGTLTVNRPMVISGEGNPGGRPVLDFSGNQDSPGNGVEINAANVTLEALTIQSAFWNNVLITGDGALIYNSEILSSSSRHGTEVNGADGARIISSTVRGNLGNLYVESGGLQIDRVDVLRAGFFSLSGYDVRSLDITGTTIVGAMDGYGVDVSLVSTGTMTVTNSTVGNNAGADFQISGGHSVAFVGSATASAPFGSGGISVGGTSTVTASNVTIDWGSLTLFDVGKAVISDVVIVDPTGEGLFINGADTDALANSVVITGSSYSRGLDIFRVGTMTVTNSSFADNSSDGIRVNEGTVLIDNVRSTGNVGSGIRVASLATVTVQAGTYSNNSGDGINIDTSGRVRLLGPVITGNGEDAVDFGSDGHTPNAQGDGIVDWPQFLSYNLSDGSLTFAYRPESLQAVDIQIYVNDACDDYGYGQLQSPWANQSISPVDQATAVYTASVPITATYAVGFATQDLQASEAGNCVLGASAANVDAAVLDAGVGATLLSGRAALTNTIGTDQANAFATYYTSSSVGADKGFSGTATSDDGTSMTIDETVSQRIYLPIVFKNTTPKTGAMLANTMDVCLRADNVVDPDKAVVAKSGTFGSADPWVPLNTTYDGTNLCTHVTSGGLFTIASNSNYSALPIVLAGLDVVVEGRSALMSWTTESEQNSLGFEIEHRAVDGNFSEFESEGFVEAAGNSSEPRTYSFEIEDLRLGRHEVRLRQIDQDGSYHYSDAVEIVVNLATAYELGEAYPNPFRGSAKFTLAVAEDQEVRVDLFDVQGRRVATLFDGTMVANREYVLDLHAGGLSSGLYFYHAIGTGFTDARSVTLVRD